MKSTPIAIAIALAALLLSACAGYPSKPAAPHLSAVAPVADLGSSGGLWPTAAWWRSYRDPTLDRLIETALASSPSLAAAHARFDSARQSVLLVGAATGAHVGLAATAERQRLSDNGLFPPSLLGFHWYNQADLGLQASYTFDWWGKQRDAVTAAVDEAHAAAAERSSAALALASSIAGTYFGWQADQGRLALARERLSVALREQSIASARARAGLDPAETVHRGELEVAAAREAIAGLEGSAKLRVVSLAALVGEPPAALPPLKPAPLPRIESALPSDVGIDLIAHRADITASRWRVEAAESRSASARAEFLPDISVNALAGLSSIDFGKLLQYGSRVPQVSVAVHLPIFDAGQLRARYGATRAELRAAVAVYDQTVIEAARDVATQAATLAQLAAEKGERERELRAQRLLEHSAAARVRQGVSDPRGELAARMSVLEQRDALVQFDAAEVAADVALRRALGGGYSDPPHVVKLDSTVKKPTP